jgi:hypothetical protein
MTPLERITERVSRHGDVNDAATLRPLVTLAEFFEGNDVDRSIGINCRTHPRATAAEFYDVLKGIAARPDVTDVRVQITMFHIPEWPFSDTVWVITSSSPKKVAGWFDKAVRPYKCIAGWKKRVAVEPCPVPSGMKPVRCYWESWLERWNESRQRYEPYSPGKRSYPSLTAPLQTQLDRIPFTTDYGKKYYPCLVTLTDGRKQDFVYIADADEYIDSWGVWPDHDSDMREIRAEDVRKIQESPSRLPPSIAQRLYEAGESGMGYEAFQLSYGDGSRSYHFTQGAVDFVRLPNGKRGEDIVDVHPHKRPRKCAPGKCAITGSHEYFWCLIKNG